ncbi:MAG: hypothetical protein R3E67_02230 [Pseudomonadales bacterium]
MNENTEKLVVTIKKCSAFIIDKFLYGDGDDISKIRNTSAAKNPRITDVIKVDVSKISGDDYEDMIPLIYLHNGSIAKKIKCGRNLYIRKNRA